MATVNTTKDKLAKLTPMQSMEKTLKDNMATIGKALPSHMTAERIQRIVIALLKTTPALQECTPISILAGVFQMAQLGLEPVDGQCFLIPYNNKKNVGGQWTTIKEAQFQIGYKGLVQLFYRHLSASSLSWGIVRKNDRFSFDLGQNILSHSYDLEDDRGDVIAYWVKARNQNGGESFAVMTKGEVLKHAQRFSRAYGAGPWQTDFDSMSLKTVLKQLMKLLPKSVEIQRALDMDETIKTKVEPNMTEVPDQTVWPDGRTIETDATTAGNGAGEAQDKPGEIAGGNGQEPAKPAPEAKPGGNKVNLNDYYSGKDGKMYHKQTGKAL